MGKKLIQLENITKTYDGNMILDDLNLYVKENEFLTLLGPSGCGKTTLLRAIGGFAKPTEGKIRMDDVIYSGNGKMVPSDAYWYLDRCGK